ncbi:uncharacterized protein CIMG_07921 [Coccidioides immitis RS]|uniref:Uncharacterized protein n=4 Tax=Coccidioides immitis TaxID=5501 RepID=J3K4E7_COCIM|nr:uncharacterized protein CIMG_07921 [Coccidioides immitis RS]EAS29175.3 hypothetical protein CIMG_07921 [Coccidioides immitis RS]KMP06296.1 hypothetical protein CIRG_05977 [Coccidioides immitis RMSCC 2394]KMU80501.1 hypothetical protein CISG_02352 [Coccidioides immitis RMSCC 3703]KMU91340.1 hypothetical protein CIHG_09217 [Coccidioides immitis H538.4]
MAVVWGYDCLELVILEAGLGVGESKLAILRRYYNHLTWRLTCSSLPGAVQPDKGCLALHPRRSSSLPSYYFPTTTQNDLPILIYIILGSQSGRYEYKSSFRPDRNRGIELPCRL